MEVVFWHWWVLAGLLIILELATSRFFFLWLGFAAAAVGFLLLVFPSVPLGAQCIIFGGLSVIALVAWRHYRRPVPAQSRQDRSG